MTEREFNSEEPEWMDRPQPVSDELKEDLENLVKLNRWFGSHRLIRHYMENWIVRGKSYRILDLATASGDIPRLICDFAKDKKAEVTIDAIDFQRSTLEIAKEWSHDYPQINYVETDIRTYQSDQPYDIVICSLALHHFSKEDAVAVIRNSLTLSKRHTLVADIVRSQFARIGLEILTRTVFTNPMTRNDALTSITRAFSVEEFRELAVAAGWSDFQHMKFPISRQAIASTNSFAPNSKL